MFNVPFATSRSAPKLTMCITHERLTARDWQGCQGSAELVHIAAGKGRTWHVAWKPCCIRAELNQAYGVQQQKYDSMQ